MAIKGNEVHPTDQIFYWYPKCTFMSLGIKYPFLKFVEILFFPFINSYIAQLYYAS